MQSFNFFLRQGLAAGLADLEPVVVETGQHRITLRITNVTVGMPQAQFSSKMPDIYPEECRQRHSTYKGALTVDIKARYGGGRRGSEEGPLYMSFPLPTHLSVHHGNEFTMSRVLGGLPIMVMSDRCHLAQKQDQDLMAHREEGTVRIEGQL